MKRQLLESTDKPLCLKKNILRSNMTRKLPYKKHCHTIDVKSLKKIIMIDEKNRRAFVEPRVCMDVLVKETLKKDLRPFVVPEFKWITVGGAIMGASLESSSFIYGQFNDSCHRFEIILGNGALINASKTEHPDLFAGITGSYGTLGILTLIELNLKSTKKQLRLYYRSFVDKESYMEFIRKISLMQAKPDFLEGLVLSKSCFLAIAGKEIEVRGKFPFFSMKHYFSPWFYQHVISKTKELPIKDISFEAQFEDNFPKELSYIEEMSIKDYLFRYDKAAFWMGQYLTQLGIIRSLIIDCLKGDKQLSRCMAALKQACYPVEKVSYLFRLLFAWKMSSRRLYQTLHRLPQKILSDNTIIQDCYIPIEKAKEMLDTIEEMIKIYPIWLCPIKGSSEEAILSPHYSKNSKNALFLNIGVYGMTRPCQSAQKLLKELENQVYLNQGRKMLYGDSQYTPEQFWDIYDQKSYRYLREQYHAEGVFPTIEEKVL